MKTRDAVLDYQYVAKDTETYKKDLSLVEPISAIELEVQCTNGATSNKGNFISDIVTKIEVVDGSEVLYGLNMSQLEALHFYKLGKMPVMFPSEWPGGGQRHNVLLMFGRYLWDRDYAFNAKSFKNPKLNITFNKAAIRAAGDEGFASGNNILLTVAAKVFEDVPAPGAFLMAKQIENFTGASSGEKRVELPVDLPYRMILGRFWRQGYDIDELITDIKMTCDTDKVIPFNRKTQQLDAAALSFGVGEVKHDMFFGHGDSIRLIFNKEPFCTPYAQAPGTPRMFNLTAQWSSQLSEVEVYAHDGTLDTTDRKVTVWEKGHAPHACLPIVFGRPNMPEDWFDPTVYKKLELVLTQAVGTSVCEIAAEQVRKQ
jgi:hypothetical protein